MKLSKENFRLGRLSGYPICCILTFYVRCFLIDNPLTKTYMRNRWKKTKMDDFRHISCWFHTFLYKIKLYRLEYHTCSGCGWEQLNDSKCRMEPVHESEMRPFINSHYSDQVKNKGYIWFKMSGKIAEEEEKKLKATLKR